MHAPTQFATMTVPAKLCWQSVEGALNTLPLFIKRNTAPRAVSSVVEHCLHTAGVAGSNPAPRTTPFVDLVVFSSASLMVSA